MTQHAKYQWLLQEVLVKLRFMLLPKHFCFASFCTSQVFASPLCALALGVRVQRGRCRGLRAVSPPSAPGAVPGFGHLPLIGLGALGVPGQRQPHQRMGELQEIYGLRLRE